MEERNRRVREELVRERREQARLEEEAAVQQRVRKEKAIRKRVRAIVSLQQLGRPLTLEEQEKVNGLEGLQLELGQLGQDELVGGAQAAVSEGVRDEVMMMKVSALHKELMVSQERVRELESGLASGEIGRKMVQDEADMKWRKWWRGRVMAGTEVCNECGRKAVVRSKGVQTEIVRGVGDECVERGVQCDEWTVVEREDVATPLYKESCVWMTGSLSEEQQCVSGVRLRGGHAVLGDERGLRALETAVRGCDWLRRREVGPGVYKYQSMIMIMLLGMRGSFGEEGRQGLKESMG